MSSATISDELSRKIADIVSGHDGWTEDNKTRILAEYMKAFNEVWKEAVNIFNSEKSQSQCQSAETEEKTIATEDLEEAEIRHEGTLIAVTKKRKEYPAKIASLLGKSTRLQKNAVEVLKVDLPPRPPLETDNKAGHLNTNIAAILKDTSQELSENMSNLQPHNHRLAHLAEAMEILSSNKNNPVEALISDCSV